MLLFPGLQPPGKPSPRDGFPHLFLRHSVRSLRCSKSFTFSFLFRLSIFVDCRTHTAWHIWQWSLTVLRGGIYELVPDTTRVCAWPRASTQAKIGNLVCALLLPWDSWRHPEPELCHYAQELMTCDDVRLWTLHAQAHTPSRSKITIYQNVRNNTWQTVKGFLEGLRFIGVRGSKI